jgi:hypothetical protein
MAGRNILIRKIILGILGLILFIFSGVSFYRSRNLKEPVVVGPSVTKVGKLSDYYSPIKGSINDCNVYILEGEEGGGTVFVMGGAHPEEPAARLAPWIFVENGIMKKGRLIVVLSSNRSGTTVTRPSGAYPPDFIIPTAWGGRKFRMGDRWSNPLDQWPDPEVYIHYPSGQNLAYVDIRNLNRCWPGRRNGTLTEKTCYAFMELIRKEKVDVFIDLHEAELQYPVISTIVSHESGLELATFVSMLLTDQEGFNMGMEYSPKNLHGLSHREVGDFSDAISLLFEAPEPFLDATRGKTTREQLLREKTNSSSRPVSTACCSRRSTRMDGLSISVWGGTHPRFSKPWRPGRKTIRTSRSYAGGFPGIWKSSRTGSVITCTIHLRRIRAGWFMNKNMSRHII